MSRVEDIFAKLGKAKFFTTLDLRSGYHHIALDEEAIKRTAFVTPLGKYEYLKFLLDWLKHQHIFKI